MSEDTASRATRRPELPESAGCFGPQDLVPLISDLIPDPIVDAVVLGYCRRQQDSISKLLQNDGRLFPECEREHYDLFCDYCKLIRSNPAGQALCRRCDVAAVRMLLGQDLSADDAKLIQPAEIQPSGALRYTCHAGHVEIVVPIWLYLLRDRDQTSVPIGAFWGGQCCVKQSHEMQETFERLHAETSIPVSELKRAYEDGERACLDKSKLPRFEKELLGIAEAISRLVTAAYHQKETLRSDSLADRLMNKLAELLSSMSAEISPSQVRQRLQEALRAAFRAHVERYYLRCSALYRVDGGDDGSALQLTPLISCPSSGACSVNVRRAGEVFGGADVQVRRGTTRATSTCRPRAASRRPRRTRWQSTKTPSVS